MRSTATAAAAATVAAIFLLAGCSIPEAPEGSDAPAASGPAAASPVAASESAEPEVSAEFRAALTAAENYVEFSPLSKEGLFRQLTSEFDKHSEEAAQYAVDTVEADWNEQALKAAEAYLEMGMSPEAIRDQLTSDADKFTAEEADYAVANLPK